MQAPVIDSLKAARGKEQYAGVLEVSALARLHDVMRAEGQLAYRIEGGMDGHGCPVLKVAVDGVATLECQRCLRDLAHTIAIVNELRLLTPAELARDGGQDGLTDPEAPDSIPASCELDVATLVEDEVLLSLPAYPRHEEGACSTEGVRDTSSTSGMKEAGAQAPTVSQHSSFGVLAALKKQ
jgi:uncharacterized protein